MRIEPVDVFDDAVLRDYHQTFHQAECYGREHPAVWTLPELTVTLRRPDPGSEREAHAAIDDGRIVGALQLDIPRLDNTHLTLAQVAVPPEHRRRGAGSRLVDHAVRRTRELDRRSIVTEVNQPLDASSNHPYVRFATRHGFTRRLVEIHQVLDLPVAGDRLADLAEQAATRHRGYRFVSWGNHCPPEYVEEFCALIGAMGSEAPMGQLDVLPERWDEHRLRDAEERRIAQGRTSYTTVAVAGDGSLAGHTQLAVPDHDPGQAYQHDTLVLPHHRGHRLGVALKVANLRRLQGRHRALRLMHTWNAEANRPMLAVNEALGFRPVERLEEWQRDLAADRSAVAG